MIAATDCALPGTIWLNYKPRFNVRLAFLHALGHQFDWAVLTGCQEDAREGRYAQAMAGFLAWLAPRYEEKRDFGRTPEPRGKPTRDR